MSNKWIPCTNWKDIPRGVWLVKEDNDHHCKYNVATVASLDEKTSFIVVGDHLASDTRPCIAYCAFDGYEDKEIEQ